MIGLDLTLFHKRLILIAGLLIVLVIQFQLDNSKLNAKAQTQTEPVTSDNENNMKRGSLTDQRESYSKISGICYKERSGYPGARIDLIDKQGLVASVTSGLGGDFQFSNIPQGHYILKASSEKLSASRTLDIGERQNLLIDVYLVVPTIDRDLWDILPVLSTFLSSVVIAIIGLLITYTIQRTQIRISERNAQEQTKAASIKAENDKRLQEGQLTAQLLSHLVSDEPEQREIAIVALQESVPSKIYDRIMAILAKTDNSSRVRLAAIERLGESSEPQSETLIAIANDPQRPQAERAEAQDSARRNAASEVLASGTIIYSASRRSSDQFPELGGSVFTYFLRKGIAEGKSDLDGDGQISASELYEYISQEVSAYSGMMPSLFVSRVSGDPIIFSQDIDYSEAYGLIIGISDYLHLPKLFSSEHDARYIFELLNTQFQNRWSPGLKLLVGFDATRANIIRALRDIEEKCTTKSRFYLYYSGHEVIGKDGQAYLVPSDSEPDSEMSMISLREVRTSLQRMKAPLKVLFLDGEFSRSAATEFR